MSAGRGDDRRFVKGTVLSRISRTRPELSLHICSRIQRFNRVPAREPSGYSDLIPSWASAGWTFTPCGVPHPDLSCSQSKAAR